MTKLKTVLVVVAATVLAGCGQVPGQVKAAAHAPAAKVPAAKAPAVVAASNTSRVAVTIQGFKAYRVAATTDQVQTLQLTLTVTPGDPRDPETGVMRPMAMLQQQSKTITRQDLQAAGGTVTFDRVVPGFASMSVDGLDAGGNALGHAEGSGNVTAGSTVKLPLVLDVRTKTGGFGADISILGDDNAAFPGVLVN